MAVRVISLVWDGYPGGGSDLLAMLALADWSDDEGRCWPSIPSIARKIRLSPVQARRVVHRLIEDGYICVSAGKTGGASSRRYQIALSRLTPLANDRAITGERGITGERPITRERTPLSPVIGDPSHSSESRTVKEPSTTRQARGTRLPDNWILPKAWGEWAQQEVPAWTPEQVRKVADVFRDYWLAKAGKDALKTDWLATWRNWVRRDAEKVKPTVAPSSGQTAFRGAI